MKEAFIFIFRVIDLIIPGLRREGSSMFRQLKNPSPLRSAMTVDGASFCKLTPFYPFLVVLKHIILSKEEIEAEKIAQTAHSQCGCCVLVPLSSTRPIFSVSCECHLNCLAPTADSASGNCNSQLGPYNGTTNE